MAILRQISAVFGYWIRFLGAAGIYFRSTTQKIYSNAVGELTVKAATTVNVEGGATANTSQKDLQFTVVGTGIMLKEGTNAKMGTATLVAGTVTVSTTVVTTSSRIFLTGMSAGAGAATWGALTVDEAKIVAGTSFVIDSNVITDTRKVRWMILEPS